MARKLGLNPTKLGGIANASQEPWKVPLPQFLERLYLKRFGVPRPAKVISLEELISQREARKKEKRNTKNQASRSKSVTEE